MYSTDYTVDSVDPTYHCWLETIVTSACCQSMVAKSKKIAVLDAYETVAMDLCLLKRCIIRVCLNFRSNV